MGHSLNLRSLPKYLQEKSWIKKRKGIKNDQLDKKSFITTSITFSIKNLLVKPHSYNGNAVKILILCSELKLVR